MIRWWRQRRHVHTWRGVLIYDAIRWTCDECGKTKTAWPQGLSDGSVAGPRAEEEGMDGRWFVRPENCKLPIHLGDDYRRQKSTVWPSEDDDLTEPP